jgi:hypothetical protein
MRIVLRIVNEFVPGLVLSGEAESLAIVPLPDLLDDIGQAADRRNSEVLRAGHWGGSGSGIQWVGCSSTSYRE